MTEDHLKQTGNDHPVAAAPRDAGFVQPQISPAWIHTGERHAWRIEPELQDWLDRLERAAPVRVGALHLDPTTDSIEIDEAGQRWARVRQFDQPPRHHVKFRIELFCEQQFAKAMLQNGLDFDAERPRLEQGDNITIEYEAKDLNPAHTVTYQKDVVDGDPRLSCDCQRCLHFRIARRNRRLPFLFPGHRPKQPTLD